MKKLLTFMVGLFICVQVNQAQNQLRGPVNGVQFLRAISPDGKYAVGQTVPKEGFLWDIEAGNTIVKFGIYGFAVNDSGWVAVSFRDSNYMWTNPDDQSVQAIESAGLYKNGEIISLGLGFNNRNDFDIIDGSSANAISSDGSTLAGYAKEKPSNHVYPYSWTFFDDGSSAEAAWASPAQFEQGPIIADMSGDTRKAVGRVKVATTDGVWSAIYWTSFDDYRYLLDDSISLGEFFCISPNGQYAGFKQNGICGIFDMDEEKVITTFTAEQAYLINGISDNGMAVGVFQVNNQTGTAKIYKSFVWHDDIGYMTFGEFFNTYSGITLNPTTDRILVGAFNAAEQRTACSMNDISADGLSMTIHIDAGAANKLGYVFEMSSIPFTKIPYVSDLAAEVSVPDRNKVILTWSMPDTVGYQDSLVNFVLYRDDDSITSVASDVFTYTDEDVPNGKVAYTIKVVYKESVSKRSDKVEAIITDTYELPFIDKFDSKDFATNYWTAKIVEGRGDWAVDNNFGVEAQSPGVRLETRSSQGFYSAVLESKYLDATELSEVYLNYAVLAVYYESVGFTVDTIYVDVYADNTWTTVDHYAFPNLMYWSGESLDLSDLAAGKLFKFRFRVEGSNSTINLKTYFFDDIQVSGSPESESVVAPSDLISSVSGSELNLAWREPGGYYALTHVQTPMRNAFGNAGVPFIAAHVFTAEDLKVHEDAYLTSITVYIHHKFTDSDDYNLKLAVFKNGTRVISTVIPTYTAKAWNAFELETPFQITSDITDLKIGIEVVQHDSRELPIGADDFGFVVVGKGDIYSTDNGASWKKLSDSTDEVYQRNWCIIGDIKTDLSSTHARQGGIVGYNVYRDGEKLNDYLIFAQNYKVEDQEAEFTVRAYEVDKGLTAATDELHTAGPSGIFEPIDQSKAEIRIYPNPAAEQVFVEGEVKMLKIYDLNGRLMAQTTKNTVSVSELKDGMYIIFVETANRSYAQKLVVKK